MRHSLRQTKKSILPVKLARSVNDEIEDGLWLTEIERFPFIKNFDYILHRIYIIVKCFNIPFDPNFLEFLVSQTITQTYVIWDNDSVKNFLERRGVFLSYDIFLHP